MLKPNNYQSFDYHDENGKVYSQDCPYFEGKEVCGYLKAGGTIDDFELNIYVNNFGIERNITIPFDKLFAQTNKMAILARKGLILKARNVKDALGLLQSQAQSLKRHANIKHKRLGLEYLAKQYVYLKEENILNETKYKYDGDIKLRKGDKQAYECFLHNTVFKSRNLTLAYMIGMSAPVVSLLEQESVVSYNAIFIDFAGKSSTGKSTLARLALSPFGNPSFNRNGLGFTHNTTDNAIYDSFDGVQGLPRVLDDINQKESLNIGQLIYTVASGEAKRRAKNTYKVNENGWSGTIIATTETPIILDTVQKGGIYARVLTLELPQWTSSREEAELINSIVQTNYGLTGQDFVAHLLTDIDYIKERFAVIRREVDSKITVRDSLTDRISEQIAAIALTVDCYLRYYPNAFQWSYSDLIEPFIESEQKMVYERDIGKRILNILREYISTNTLHFNLENFYIDGIISNPPWYADVPFGVIKNYWDSKDLSLKYRRVYVYSEHFIDLMTRKKVFDFKAGLSLLRQKGRLICDLDKRLQTKIGNIRCYCFMIEEDIGGDD